MEFDEEGEYEQYINPQPVDFLKWNNPFPFLELSIIIFKGYQDKTFKGSILFLFYLFRLQIFIAFGSSRIRVKI